MMMHKPYTSSADVYSMGVILWEMLTKVLDCPLSWLQAQLMVLRAANFA
jgi:serine/threonine protein kinase